MLKKIYNELVCLYDKVLGIWDILQRIEESLSKHLVAKDGYRSYLVYYQDQIIRIDNVTHLEYPPTYTGFFSHNKLVGHFESSVPFVLVENKKG